MSFFDMHFALPLAATAAGLKHDTASKWIKRGELVIRPEDREKVGRGGGVILTARTTLQLITAAELARRGLKIADACEAAINFAHWGDVAGDMGATQDRQPGHLFSDGITLFLIDRDHPERSRLRSFTGKEPLSAIRGRLDSIDMETLLMMKLGPLGIDVHAAMKEIKE